MTIRPSWRSLFGKVGRAPAVVDYSLGPKHEDAGTGETAPEELPTRASDPASPLEGEKWIRADKDPPEMRLYSGGRVWTLAFSAATLEPAVPLVPDVGLAPPLIPEGVAYGPLAPDLDLAPPLVPEGV